mgnify:CR=1 FL=1
MAGRSGSRSGGRPDDPGSGVATSRQKKGGGKRKAIMSQSAWDKLSAKQRDDLGGSRFKNVGGPSSGERGSGQGR